MVLVLLCLYSMGISRNINVFAKGKFTGNDGLLFNGDLDNYKVGIWTDQAAVWSVWFQHDQYRDAPSTSRKRLPLTQSLHYFDRDLIHLHLKTLLSYYYLGTELSFFRSLFSLVQLPVSKMIWFKHIQQINMRQMPQIGASIKRRNEQMNDLNVTSKMA